MSKPEDGRSPSGRATHEPSPTVSAVSVGIPSAVKLISQRKIIRGVATRWRQTYGHGHYARDAEKQRIQKALDRLDLESCTPNDIAQIIGNRSWTDNECDVCRERDCDVIAQIGDEPDYDMRWQNICLPCLAGLGSWAAQAIETRRAETGTGSVHESAVPQECAPRSFP